MRVIEISLKNLLLNIRYRVFLNSILLLGGIAAGGFRNYSLNDYESCEFMRSYVEEHEENFLPVDSSANICHQCELELCELCKMFINRRVIIYSRGVGLSYNWLEEELPADEDCFCYRKKIYQVAISGKNSRFTIAGS